MKTGATFCRTALRIQPVILGPMLTKSVRFSMDVRSVTHDTVSDNTKAMSTDPMGTYTEAVVTSKTKVEDRGHVQSNCTANSTCDFGTNVDQKCAIFHGCEVSNA